MNGQSARLTATAGEMKSFTQHFTEEHFFRPTTKLGLRLNDCCCSEAVLIVLWPLEDHVLPPNTCTHTHTQRLAMRRAHTQTK